MESNNGNGSRMRVKLVAADDSFITYDINKQKPLVRMMIEYCSREFSEDMDEFYFIFRGKKINDSDTPISLDMKEGDIIKVVRSCCCFCELPK